MSKWIALSLLILFSSTSQLFAQNNFHPGYVVSFQGDTLTGLVDLEDQRNSFKRCHFKQGDAISEFSSKDIRGFGIDGKKAFVSGVLPDVFVEALVLGQLSLYKAPEGYIITKGGKQYNLRSEPVEQLIGSQRVLVDNKWRGLLTSQIGDCLSGPGERTASTRFGDKAIGKVVEDYNQCVGSPSYTVKSNLKWAIARFFVSAHVDFSAPNLMESNYAILYLPDRFSSVKPGLGIGIKTSFPRLNDRVSFQLESVLRFGSYQETTTRNFGEIETRIDELGFSLASLVFPLNFGYTLPLGRQSLEIHGGIHFGFNLKKTSYWHVQRYFRGEIITDEERAAPFDIGTGNFGFQGGLTYWMDLSKMNVGVKGQYYHSSLNDGSPELIMTIANTSIGIVAMLGKK